MSRYPLSLPNDLKRDAERMAKRQGVSLNQFILWSVAEKVGELRHGVDDPNFPGIGYRRGASGQPVPALRGTGIRVETLVVANQQWGLSMRQVAEEYELPEAQVKEALDFYQAHKLEIDSMLQAEQDLENQALPNTGRPVRPCNEGAGDPGADE